MAYVAEERESYEIAFLLHTNFAATSYIALHHVILLAN